jgi:hypothetical protein
LDDVVHEVSADKEIYSNRVIIEFVLSFDESGNVGSKCFGPNRA